MTKSKREREREHFNREARQMFGIGAKVQGVSHATPTLMGAQINEEKRLAAVHDAGKPSACRLCGQTVEPTTPGWRTVDGWKCCARCSGMLPTSKRPQAARAALAAVWTDVLGIGVEAHEATPLGERLGLANPSYFVHRWATEPGSPTRWAHLDPELAVRGREALAGMRVEAEARSQPRPNTYGTGCAFCGVQRSTAWTTTPWRFGRGPQAPRAAACSDCEPWVTRAGGYAESWRPNLLAACVGMRRGLMEVTYGLVPYFESNPADPSGTDEPWQYLGDVRAKLRARVIREHPRLVTLTANEERVRALERAVAEATAPDDRPPLARL
jgi:hypothetical protein